MNYRQSLDQKKGQLKLLQNRATHLNNGLETLTELQGDLEQAQAIIQEVAQQTQEQLKYHISELVTLALASVFDHPYEFEVDFVQKRNQTECDLWFVRNGERIDPMTASGGGVIDVVSFALRVSLWSLQQNRAVVVLDEPFKHLSNKHLPRACELLQTISKRLNLQFLIVSHSEELIDAADRVFECSIKKGVSCLKLV